MSICKEMFLYRIMCKQTFRYWYQKTISPGLKRDFKYDIQCIPHNKILLHYKDGIKDLYSK